MKELKYLFVIVVFLTEMSCREVLGFRYQSYEVEKPVGWIAAEVYELLTGEKRKSKPNHGWICEDAMNLLISKYGTKYIEIKAYIEDIKRGAKEEDALLADPPYIPGIGDIPAEDGWRTNYHAYDPYTKQGVSGYASALDWALGHPENCFDIIDAFGGYERANLAHAYICLGHVLHLLQDLSVPWHTTPPFPNKGNHDDYEYYLGYQKNYFNFNHLAKEVAKPDLFERYGTNYTGAITELFHDMALLSHGKTVEKPDFYKIAEELVPKAIEYNKIFL